MSIDVVITGANRGIGLEYARRYAERGDRVIATCRDVAGATELNALDVRVEPLDVVSAAAVANFADSLGDAPIDMLINNAGVGVRSRPLGELDFEEVEAFFRTNALAPLRLGETLLPNLRRAETRRIINMTSRMGSISDNSSGGSYAYRASKAALNMFNRSLSIDLADEGFTCVVLHPGWVQTDMGGGAAPTSVGDSVAGLMQVIDNLTRQDSGRFFDFTGQEVPW